ncbi:MAG TPA: beta-phosphoglucomutase [Sediminispirochaeta sp.]|nr:beta-phosphoglucomutase [Sediminispirochaeta sp.]
MAIHEWKIEEERLESEKMAEYESIFSLANGYIGVRACFEEMNYVWNRGTFLNGFYESRPIIYGERAYGYPEHSQTILNVADGRKIQLWLEDEPFDLSTGKILHYHRELDVREGVLRRRITWRSPKEKSIEVLSERLVPFQRKHIVALRYLIRSIDFKGRVRLVSSLDGNVSNYHDPDDPRSGAGTAAEPLVYAEINGDSDFGELVARTTESQLSMACGVTHRSWKSERDGKNRILKGKKFSQTGEVGDRYDFSLEPGGEFGVDKFISYSYRQQSEEARNIEVMRRELEKAAGDGFDRLKEEEFSYLSNFWEHADVSIDGDLKLQQGIRFNLFQLLQSVGRDGMTSIPAKGLSGEGYEGHYFWDTEIYVLPLFIYTLPRTAQSLLEYRYSILEQARRRAEKLSQRGALFPWRTINGEEASAYYPAGTAQYHIDADISYGIKKFIEITGTRDFLPRAAEILIETARLWADLGEYVDRQGGAFCINGVTGPDEYTALVNNNYYTNIMAQNNLEFACRVLEELEEYDRASYTQVVNATGLREEEVEQWRRAAEAMFLPYDANLGIHPQDDSFLNKKIWPISEIPKEKRPLLLHYHPLVIYRHQIIKQADTVLALFLQGDKFSLAEKRRDFEYYDRLTTGDSSLSACVQSVIAAEVGRDELAYDYFRRTARIDLDNVNGNVRDGLHLAAMAGTWTSIVYGFAGLRDYDGQVSFEPHLPRRWKRLTFNLNVRGSLLEVAITHNETAYTLKEGEPLGILHEGQAHTVYPGSPLVFSMRPDLEAVIFDLDGVITDSAEYHYQAWKRLADELEVPFDREFNQQLKGVGRMESLELLLSRRPELRLSEEEKQSLADRKNSHYQELIKKIRPADLLPGIAEVLKELREAGIKIALASASRNAPTIIDQLKVGEFFDIITDPDEIDRGKPDPEQFYLAARKLGVPRRNCVGVEDAQAGVEAINAAGMFSVGVGDYLINADWKCSGTDELRLERLREVFYKRSEEA